MKTAVRRLAVALLCIPAVLVMWGCLSSRPYRDSLVHEGREIPKAEVEAMIRQVLDEGGDLDSAARNMLALIGPDSDAGWVISEGLWRGEDPGEFLRRAEATLDHEVVVEAELPAGYPEPSYEGLIRVKSYPSVRIARVDTDTGGFMTLFRHIDENNISMTSPVEMSYRDAGATRSAMAFSYANAEIGAPGNDGEVEILDTEPREYVSVGQRGGYSDSGVRDALGQLEGWLAENGDRWVRTGEPRVLAYNSPFVLWWMKYREIQIPVRSVRGEVAAFSPQISAD